MQMQKIIHCITDCSSGGAERQLLRLLPELKKCGYDSEIWTIRAGGSLRTDFDNLGVSVRPLADAQGNLLSAYFRCGLRLYREKPALLIAWMHPAFALVSCANIRSTTLIFNVRQSYENLSEESFLSQLAYTIARFRIKKAAAVLCNSYSAVDEFKKIHPSVTFLPNGFPLEMPTENIHGSSERFRIGLFARVHPMKGHAFLLEQASALTKSGYALEIVLLARERWSKFPVGVR